MILLFELLQTDASSPIKLTAILIVLIGIVAMVFFALYENCKSENKRLTLIMKKGTGNLEESNKEKDSKSNEQCYSK